MLKNPQPARQDPAHTYVLCLSYEPPAFSPRAWFSRSLRPRNDSATQGFARAAGAAIAALWPVSCAPDLPQKPVEGLGVSGGLLAGVAAGTPFTTYCPSAAARAYIPAPRAQ